MIIRFLAVSIGLTTSSFWYATPVNSAAPSLLARCSLLATHVARNVAAGAEMFQRGKVEKGRCNSPLCLPWSLPSPPLRCYYVVRRREGVHFLATHDKQITFERLIPRHYSPVSPHTLLPTIHSWARVIRSPIKGGILMKFSLFPRLSRLLPFCQRSLHPPMEVGIS